MLKTAHVFRAQGSLRLKAKPRYPRKSPTLTAISLIAEYLIAWNPHISNYIYRVISLKAQNSFHFPSWFLNMIQNTYHNVYTVYIYMIIYVYIIIYRYISHIYPANLHMLQPYPFSADDRCHSGDWPPCLGALHLAAAAAEGSGPGGRALCCRETRRWREEMEIWPWKVGDLAKFSPEEMGINSHNVI